MAHSTTTQAKEIEVKYRLADIKAAEQALTNLGVAMGPAITQDDQAFAPVGWTYADSNVGITFCRLRTQGDRHIFTAKHPVENQFSCLEYETEVADPAAMAEAVKLMGFYPTTRIVKTRRTGAYEQFEVCLDEVEGVGSFLEVEQMADAATDPTELMASLHAFVESLNLDAQEVHDGYDVLVHNLEADRG